MQRGITADEAKSGDMVLEGTWSALTAGEHKACVTRLELAWTHTQGGQKPLSTGCPALLPVSCPVCPELLKVGSQQDAFQHPEGTHNFS